MSKKDSIPKSHRTYEDVLAKNKKIQEETRKLKIFMMKKSSILKSMRDKLRAQ